MPLSPGQPALYRSGDIGVSAEWRAVSYDWLPVLTAHGVAIYSFLRDTYDEQRSMFPFLLTPQGPTKAQMQQRLGRKTGHALQGPEFLLSAVGLVEVELTYGPSTDSENPYKTRVVYYTIDRLQRPVLDWPMLSRVLDAVCLGLPTASADANHKKAEAALQALKLAGFLQDCDPADLFWDLGAWPNLLPQLIVDERWEALYSHLYGPASVRGYREQARQWVEKAQRTVARLAADNREMAELLQAAQRHPSQSGPTGSSHPGGPANASQPSATASQMPVTRAVGLNQTARVTGESLASHWAVGLNQTASVTHPPGSLSHAIDPTFIDPSAESPASDQLMLSSSGGDGSLPQNNFVTRPGDSGVSIAPHLNEQELHTIQHGAPFWCEVNRILTGRTDRYQPSAGEKQAAVRQFYRRQIPIGIILAALRLVMTLPEVIRPRSFADALKLDSFHLAVQQGVALLPVQSPRGQSWESFLWSYRTVALETGVRNVSTADYAVLHSLYQRWPEECWLVLSRLEHTNDRLVKLTPQYLQRAIVNNQRAVTERSLSTTSRSGACQASATGEHTVVPSDMLVDPRRELLMTEGVNPSLLQPEMSEEFIRAWIAEADARRASITHRPGWLSWGLRSGYWPHEHPMLPAREAEKHEPTLAQEAALKEAQPHDPRLLTVWQAVQTILQQMVPSPDYCTWLQETCLIELTETGGVVGVPHTFARDKVEGCFIESVKCAFATVGFPVAQIAVVLEPRVEVYQRVAGESPC